MHVVTGGLGEHRFIGCVGCGRGDGERVAQDANAKRLRRLREEDLVAGERVSNDA
jgi:hypothetical protein